MRLNKYAGTVNSLQQVVPENFVLQLYKLSIPCEAEYYSFSNEAVCFVIYESTTCKNQRKLDTTGNNHFVYFSQIFSTNFYDRNINLGALCRTLRNKDNTCNPILPSQIFFIADFFVMVINHLVIMDTRIITKFQTIRPFSKLFSLKQF